MRDLARRNEKEVSFYKALINNELIDSRLLLQNDFCLIISVHLLLLTNVLRQICVVLEWIGSKWPLIYNQWKSYLKMMFYFH